MHSYHGETCTIHYNSDMSGEIRIIQNMKYAIQIFGIDIKILIKPLGRENKSF